MKIIEWLQHFFTGQEKSVTAPSGMPADHSLLMEKVLTMLSETREEELTCDEVFSLLDQFVELAVRGEDVGKLMPLVQQHLDMCPDCREEYEALKNIVVNTAYN